MACIHNIIDGIVGGRGVEWGKKKENTVSIVK